MSTQKVNNKYERKDKTMKNLKTAKALVKLRGKRTRAEIAQALGITKSAIAMYERGERIPRDDIKKKIALFYGKTVDEIFFAH